MTDQSTPHQDVSELDTWTSGAFTAATSGERAAKLREWLLTNPSINQLQAVFREMSHRDKGAAKAVRERLDELRRAQNQDAIVQEWAEKAQLLCDAPKLNLADALAWQRDAAKAGAPLSREPLSALKNALAERVKAIEDLQHQTLVQREAAVLLAQRVEVLSTKAWQDALAQKEAIQADVHRWQQQAQSLQTNAQWASVDVKFPTMLQTSDQQIQAVWEAFGAALDMTQTAANDASAALPAVPAWADQIKQTRGGFEAAAPVVVAKTQGVDATRVKKYTADKSVIDAQRLELAMKAEALFKPAAALDAVQSTELPASSMDVPQEASATSTAEASVAPAEVTGVALSLEPVVTGRKLQESLRELRETWKKIDKEAAPHPALWKRFDTACNRAHDIVQAWLKETRAQNSAVKNQRLALIEEVRTWTQTHANGPDWRAVARQLHEFAQRWREAGHLSEKAYAELQPQWKTIIHAAHEPWETAQKASIERRQALIAQAKEIAQAPSLRVDAVKALQQRWQQEAQTVALDRKQEQKLWDAFRQPIDHAFSSKPVARERDHAHPPLGAHDKAVFDAAKALEAASASADANQIRQAMTQLEQVLQGNTAPVVTPVTTPAATDQAALNTELGSEAQQATTQEDATPAPALKPARPVVAVRGDDRPGQKRTEVATKTRDGKGRDARDGKGRDERARGKDFAPRAPRLADVAFRAQRHAMDAAQTALRQLAAQAHGEVLTQLMQAWEARDALQMPALQALGSKLTAAQRSQWVQALSEGAQAEDVQALLRLEIAADVATPAAQVAARRALQLQLLTRRNDPSPQMTWTHDVSHVLSGAFDQDTSRRLLTVLKVLLRKG